MASKQKLDATKTALAFQRADAWALSVPGTPYGVLETVKSTTQQQQPGARAE